MFSNRSGALKVLQQSLRVLSDIVLRPVVFIWPHRAWNRWDLILQLLHLLFSPPGNVPLRAAWGGIPFAQSVSGQRVSPHHLSSQYHLICPRAHVLLATTSIELFPYLWSYSPEGESKLYIMNSVLSFLPWASVPRTESGIWWIPSKYLLTENFISISLSDSPASFWRSD